MKFKEGKVILFGSTKGGEGKSTMTVTAASTLSQKPYGYKVLVIDTDTLQRSIFRHREREMKMEFKGKTPPFDVIKMNAGEELINYVGSEFGEGEVRDKYDLIFIDIKGSEQNVQYSIAVSDYIFIPLVSDDYDTDSTYLFMEILNKVKAVKEKRGLDLNIHSFINMFENDALDRQLLEHGERMYNVPLMESCVKKYKSLKSMKSTFVSMLDYPQTNIYKPVMENYKAFINELLEKIK